MSPKSLLASLGLAAAISVGAAVPAIAASAVVDTNLNVRSCGSTDCRVIDVLRRGEVVDIEYCEGVWCFIEKPGRDGWVSARYLSRDGLYDDDFYDDDYFYIEPRRRYYNPRRVIRRVEPSFGACIGGANARFCVYD